MLQLPNELILLILSFLDAESLWILLGVCTPLHRLCLIRLKELYHVKPSELESGHFVLNYASEFRRLFLISRAQPGCIRRITVVCGDPNVQWLVSGLAVLPSPPTELVRDRCSYEYVSSMAQLVSVCAGGDAKMLVVMCNGTLAVSRARQLQASGFTWPWPWSRKDGHASMRDRLAGVFEGEGGWLRGVHNLSVDGEDFVFVSIPGHDTTVLLPRLPSLTADQYSAVLRALYINCLTSTLCIAAHAGLRLADVITVIGNSTSLLTLRLHDHALDPHSLEVPCAPILGRVLYIEAPPLYLPYILAVFPCGQILQF